jgi:hypothetical protein
MFDCVRFLGNFAFSLKRGFYGSKKYSYLAVGLERNGLVFAQPGNETRTTDRSLKCLAAALQ